MPTITLSEPLQLNALVWIHSLPDEEMGPTRRILEDLEDLDHQGGLALIERRVGSRDELFDLLRGLAADAADGLRPILHLDTHGAPDAGLYLDPAGEWASWPELVAALQAINVATGNNLVVIFALCHGLRLYQHVSLSQAAPAYLFAGPPDVVTFGFLADETAAFYRQVSAAGAFLEPFMATLGKKMELFNCQGLFLKVLAHYVRNQGSGAALDERVVRTAARKLERQGIVDPSPEQAAAAEQAMREELEPSQKLIDRFAPHFLIGRPPQFTFADVAAVAGPPWSDAQA